MSNKEFRCGKFKLSEPDEKYKSFGVKFYDKPSRQTKRVTLSATTREEAEREVQEYALIHSAPQKVKDEPLLTSCNRYYLQYAQVKLRSPDTHLKAIERTIAVLGEVKTDVNGERVVEMDTMVSQMGKDNQLKLINAWRAEGLSDGSIGRYLSCLWASMKYAAEEGHLAEGSVPKQVSTRRWNPKGKKRRTTVLTPEQLAALLDAACVVSNKLPNFTLAPPNARYQSYHATWHCPDTWLARRKTLSTTNPTLAVIKFEEFKKEYARKHPVVSTLEYGGAFRYVLTLIGTGCRPEAACDIKLATQANFEHGILDLNPPGRQQTKKHRPIIPLAPTLQRWFERWEPLTDEGHLIARKGRKLVKYFPLFRSIAKRAGVRATSYTIRHTVSTWLTSRVPLAWERDMFMGWVQHEDASAMGSHYNHYDPTYLRSCAHAIEALFDAIAPHMVGDVLLKGTVDQPPPIDAQELAWVNRWLVHAPKLTEPLAAIGGMPTRSPAPPKGDEPLTITATYSNRWIETEASFTPIPQSAWQVRGRAETNFLENHAFNAKKEIDGHYSHNQDGGDKKVAETISCTIICPQASR